MFVKHLDHLNLTVADLAATEAFYGTVFGFTVQERGFYNGAPWSILRSGDALLCAYEHPDFQTYRPRLAHIHGINHFSFRITDRNAWVAVLEAEGLELLYGGETRWDHSTAWYVADPSGYEIEVVLWNDDHIAFGPLAQQQTNPSLEAARSR